MRCCPARTTSWPRCAAPFFVASVSNTNEIHWDRFSNAWLLHDAFDHNFPSHLVGKLKPDAEYFAHVVEALGVPAPRVLFVDDNALNVEGAQRMGLQARQVVGVEGARAAFAELGLLPDA